MKSIVKKIGLALGVICFVGTLSFSKVLANEDIKDMGNKVITDTNKVWNVNFKDEVDISSLNDSVHIRDLTDNCDVSITFVDGDDTKCAKINPPSGGYKIGHEYKITIDKKAKSKKGKNLKRDVTLKFKVDQKGTSKYNLTANVEVASVFPILKKITITQYNLPLAAKVKLEGNNNVFKINTVIGSLVAGNEVKISIYDENEKLLATGMLDVSSTKSNVNVALNID